MPQFTGIWSLTEVQSAVILGQLERINELVEIRKKVGEIFDEVLSQVSFIVLNNFFIKAISCLFNIIKFSLISINED